MKAMILAAGEGTRLRPLTLKTPKVMLPLAGKPLLEYIIDHLRFHNVNEIAINLSHLPEAVKNWLGEGDRFGIHVTYSVEDRLLGTAGALTRLREFFDETFVVIYGDMLTDMDLSSLAKFHKAKGSLATMALFEVSNPSAYGIVEVDSDSRVTGFVEKPAPGTTSSKLANTGIYMLEPEVLDHIPSETFFDFGFNLFPKLLSQGERLYAYVTSDIFLDAGTVENFKKTEQELLRGGFFPKRISALDRK